MKHFATILFVSVCYVTHLSTGYRPRPRPYPPSPLPPPAPPVEEFPFTVVSTSLVEGSALHWDDTEKLLYFTDVTGQALYRYDPATSTQKILKLNSTVSMAIPLALQRHRMVVGLGGDLVTLQWHSNTNNFSLDHFYSADPDGPRITWGNGRADSQGRLWAEASVEDGKISGISTSSRLYYFDTVSACTANIAYGDTQGSNGLAFSPNNRVLYYSSTSRIIQAFDFDNATGAISKPRTIFDFGNYPGSPAGLTVDGDGFIWIGSYASSFIFKVEPSSGKLVRVIKLPVREVTSLVFGGPNLQDLYLTSSGSDGSGSVLKISGLNVKGVPLYPVTLLCVPCEDKKKLSGFDPSDWWCFNTMS